jgi:hypothetical protein|eukprot:COSAG01_NODE_15216_length_1360_cov_3.531324_2_plen_122_part_00
MCAAWNGQAFEKQDEDQDELPSSIKKGKTWLSDFGYRHHVFRKARKKVEEFNRVLNLPALQPSRRPSLRELIIVTGARTSASLCVVCNVRCAGMSNAARPWRRYSARSGSQLVKDANRCIP